MIKLNENSSFITNKTINLLSKYTRGRYSMDRDLILADRDNFKNMAIKATDKKYKKHYKIIEEYLTNLDKCLDSNNTLQIYWTVKDGKLVTAPFYLENMRWLGLDTVDYIMKRDDRTVVVSYKDLWNAMSIQLAHRDLEFTTKEIDMKLSENGCRIHGLEGIEKLFNCTMHNAYNMASQLKVEDTPYVDRNGIVQYKTYFGDKIKGNNYKDLIDKSVDKALTIIVVETLEKLGVDGVEDVEFMGVFEDRIYYNTSLPSSEINQKLAMDICIRLFGRTFEIKPTAEIY